MIVPHRAFPLLCLAPVQHPLTVIMEECDETVVSAHSGDSPSGSVRNCYIHFGINVVRIYAIRSRCGRCCISVAPTRLGLRYTTRCRQRV